MNKIEVNYTSISLSKKLKDELVEIGQDIKKRNHEIIYDVTPAQVIEIMKQSYLSGVRRG